LELDDLRRVAHYLVIDFEATCCDQGLVPRAQMEIIEFGAVMVDAATLQVVDEFACFVQPVRHPRLTPFCIGLTSITQRDVDEALPLATVLADFRAWLNQYQDFVFCSWGDYDLKQLQQDCAYHQLSYPINAPHCNLKRALVERQQLNGKPGLGDAIRLAGLRFAGTHHRGIDDARNIARLLPFIVGDQVLPTKWERPRKHR
jgi:inhibitor of KinA sporulation pathway (predicted exonuclease)